MGQLSFTSGLEGEEVEIPPAHTTPYKQHLDSLSVSLLLTRPDLMTPAHVMRLRSSPGCVMTTGSD